MEAQGTTGPRALRFGTCKGMDKLKPRAERATGNLLVNVEIATWNPKRRESQL